MLKKARDVYQMYHMEAITKTGHLQSANNGTENNLERAISLLQPEHRALIVSCEAALKHKSHKLLPWSRGYIHPAPCSSGSSEHWRAQGSFGLSSPQIESLLAAGM